MGNSIKAPGSWDWRQWTGQPLQVADPRSPWNGEVVELELKAGRVADIRSTDAQPAALVSPGWVDLQAELCAPGYEYRETLSDLALLAARGGFTDVLVVPHTTPALDHGSVWRSVVEQAVGLPTRIHPAANLSMGGQGEQMAELNELVELGATAFSDAGAPLQNDHLLWRCLLYLSQTGRPVFQQPLEASFQALGVANDSLHGLQAGLPAISPLGEQLLLARNLEVLAHTPNAHLVVGPLTTGQSVEQLRRARQQGRSVSGFTAAPYLWLEDSYLLHFDVHTRVNPPLRTRADAEALRQACAEGLLVGLASFHQPRSPEEKDGTFVQVVPGMHGLLTAFPQLVMALLETQTLPLDKLIDLLTHQPRRLLQLEPTTLEVDQPACLTVFDPKAYYSLELEDFAGAAANTPLLGKELVGRALATVLPEWVA